MIATIYVTEKFENNSWPEVDFDCPVVGEGGELNLDEW